MFDEVCYGYGRKNMPSGASGTQDDFKRFEHVVFDLLVLHIC